MLLVFIILTEKIIKVYFNLMFLIRRQRGWRPWACTRNSFGNLNLIIIAIILFSLKLMVFASY